MISRIDGALAAAALAFTIAALSIPEADSRETITGFVETVVDGDSLKLTGNRRIRLYGVDAVELHQTCSMAHHLSGDWYCGHEAWAALYDMVKRDRQVTCLVHDTDFYGRPVASCSNSEGDLGRRVVARGWALAARKYSDRYVHEEEAARAERLGIWGGGFTDPAQWRRERRR